MSYKAGIIQAITELKDRTGSSSIAIKKRMQAEMGDKKWLNGMFLKALKDGVAAGDLVKVEDSFKLSADFKKKVKKASKPKKAAPKKKASSLVRLGAPEKASSLQFGMIEGREHPSTSTHAATKITCGVLGIATTAAVGLYLYKKRRTTNTKTKNTEQQEETEHSDSVPDPDPMESV
eukprot:scaffold4277_cov140-Skeletonema_menzelii.AAC.4